ncbi:HTH-type transcriptional regulator, repressor for puuD [Chryseobacterium taichungense]|uniref:HTH-type transcriptional regulator, repressor for puuD n=2 Tax=Chryseobacterium taichungense TaxID=295069 RepID=A0A1H7XQA7_9FLAO|nr:HTH-type transcriptional regulator, repressor for puuD [Chryseobacterium taichungense]
MINFPNCFYNISIMDKIEFRVAFGKRVENFRKKLGLSYRQLAQKCDIDHSNISKIEKGEVDLRISTIQELAKGLEVHPQELFDFKMD